MCGLLLHFGGMLMAGRVNMAAVNILLLPIWPGGAQVQNIVGHVLYGCQ